MSESETIDSTDLVRQLPDALPREVWLTRLMEPANKDWLRQALSTFPPGMLIDIYRGQFKPQDKASYLLLRIAGLKQANDGHVLGSIERIYERRPKVLEALVGAWFDHYHSPLLALGRGEEIHMEAHPQALEVGCWLWEGDDSLSQPTWAMVRTLLKRPTLPTPGIHKDIALELEITTQKLEAVTQALEALKKQLEKLEREKNKLHKSREDLDKQYNKLRQEKDALAGQLQLAKQSHRQVELQVKQATVRADQLQQELDRHSKSFEQVRRDLFEREQEIIRLRQNNQDGSNRLLRVHQEVDSLKGEYKELQQRYWRLERQSTHQAPLPQKLIEQALIVDYPNIGSSPIDRLIGLFELYQAFLKGEEHAIFKLHTNWNDLDGQKPTGILLLGLERMLLDGVNTPLVRYLKASVFGTETLLHSLIHRLNSPRLEEP